MGWGSRDPEKTYCILDQSPGVKKKRRIQILVSKSTGFRTRNLAQPISGNFFY
jgi:hypothetical protein